MHKYKRPFLYSIVALCMLGHGIECFIYGTKIGTILFLNLKINDQYVYWVEKLLGVGIIIYAIMMYAKQNSKMLIGFGLWPLMKVMAIMISGGAFASQYVVLPHLNRFLTCFAFRFNKKTANELIKIGLGITFIGHGIEAFMENPLFTDYIYTLFEWANIQISDSTVIIFLTLIGIIDIVAGVLYLAFDWKYLHLYMGFWGFITAVYRIPYYGAYGVVELLIRVYHFALPWYFAFSKKELEI